MDDELRDRGDLKPKVHPASREILPDDPMELHGVEVPGDPEWMLQLLAEEYGRMGWTAESILRLAKDPFYQAFHGLYLLHGEEEFLHRVEEILSRSGICRVKAVDTSGKEV